VTREPRILIYTGPTLTADEVRAVIPHGEVRPPAGRGDLLAEQWRPGDTAVVLDGYFRERRSVGHKEILQVLAEGAEVVGAASMGALRAAELGPCGMRGRGTVFAMYTSGQIDGDDEVGVLHGPAATGYPASTVALVNLRHACAEAAREGLVSADAAERIVHAAKALPFTHRGWDDIAAALDESDRPALAPLREGIEAGRWDLKRLDALAALRELAERDHGAQGSGIAPHVPFTGISRTQALVRGSTRQYAPGREMSDLAVLNAARLFDEGYPALHEKVLTGLLEDLACAHGQSLQAYALAKLGLDGSCPPPDPLSRWLTEHEAAELPCPELIRLLMIRVWPVWQSPDWRPAVIGRLRESGSWDEWCTLVAEADDATATSKLPVPPSAACGKLFPRHWKAPGTTPEIEAARRGFPGLDELGASVTRFFAYDIRRGRARAAAY
jgi:hypothetical protein